MDDFLESSSSEDSDAIDNEVEAALYSMVHHRSDTYEWVYETNMLQFRESCINNANRWEAYKEIESQKTDNYINSQEIKEEKDQKPLVDSNISNKSKTIFGQQFNRRGHNVNYNRNNRRNEKSGNVHDRIRINCHRNRSHDPDFVQRNEVYQQYSVDPQAAPKIHNVSSFERPRSNFEDENHLKESKGENMEFVEKSTSIVCLNDSAVEKNSTKIVEVSTAISDVVAISDTEVIASSDESVVEVSVPPKPPPPLVSLDSSDELDNSDEVMIVDSKKSCVKKPTGKKSHSNKSHPSKSHSNKSHSKNSRSNKSRSKNSHSKNSYYKESFSNRPCSKKSKKIKKRLSKKPSQPLVCYSSSSYSSSSESADELEIVVDSKKYHSKKRCSKKPSPPLVGLDSSDEFEMIVDSETSRVLNVSENNKLTIDSPPGSQSTSVRSKSYTNPFFGFRINNPISSTSKEIKNKKKKNQKHVNSLKKCSDPRKIKCSMWGEREYLENSNKVCLKCGRPSLSNEGCPCLNRLQNCATYGGEGHFTRLCPDAQRNLNSVSTTEELEVGTLNETRCKFSLELKCCCAEKGHLAAECPKRSNETSSFIIPSRRNFNRRYSV